MQVKNPHLGSGNHTSLKLYLVSEGEVYPASVGTEWDGESSVLVAATSQQSALVVARAYDAGDVQADNLAFDGVTVAAVSMRDRDTGLYV